MLNEPRQRHAVRFGELGDGQGTCAQRFEHGTARRIGERCEDGVKIGRATGVQILNHMVQYRPPPGRCQRPSDRALKVTTRTSRKAGWSVSIASTGVTPCLTRLSSTSAASSGEVNVKLPRVRPSKS